MGWKVSILFIDKIYPQPFTDLILELGLGESEVVEKAPMGFLQYAYHPEISVGYYQDKTIILYNYFIDELFQEEPSALELQIGKVFNDCQMLLLIYHENDGERGFSLFDKGKRIRTKLVEDYEGTIVDFGPKLEEEKTNKFLTVWDEISRRLIGKDFLDEVGNLNKELGLENVEMVTLKLKTKV